MNKWHKVGLAAGMGTAVIATTHIINKFIFKYATINNYTFEINQKIVMAGNLEILLTQLMVIKMLLLYCLYTI